MWSLYTSEALLLQFTNHTISCFKIYLGPSLSALTTYPSKALGGWMGGWHINFWQVACVLLHYVHTFITDPESPVLWRTPDDTCTNTNMLNTKQLTGLELEKNLLVFSINVVLIKASKLEMDMTLKRHPSINKLNVSNKNTLLFTALRYINSGKSSHLDDPLFNLNKL